MRRRSFPIGVSSPRLLCVAARNCAASDTLEVPVIPLVTLESAISANYNPILLDITLHTLRFVSPILEFIYKWNWKWSLKFFIFFFDNITKKILIQTAVWNIIRKENFSLFQLQERDGRHELNDRCKIVEQWSAIIHRGCTRREETSEERSRKLISPAGKRAATTFFFLSYFLQHASDSTGSIDV